MIIFLLLDNPVVRRVLSEEEVQEVEIMAPYVALHYLLVKNRKFVPIVDFDSSN